MNDDFEYELLSNVMNDITGLKAAIQKNKDDEKREIMISDLCLIMSELSNEALTEVADYIYKVDKVDEKYRLNEEVNENIEQLKFDF